jgi:putative solute:sodium symporter small subunit
MSNGGYGWGRRFGTGATIFLALLIGIGLPLAVQLLNLATVAGFPLGFYAAAEGAPLILCLLVAVQVVRAERADRRAAASFRTES